MAITTIDNQWRHIENAIDTVKTMLLKKRDIWTSSQSPFENFDIAEEFHMKPIQWGLSMCNLKLNRLKKRYNLWMTEAGTEGLSDDPDFEDSLVDLASYAILTLGLIEREKAQKKTTGTVGSLSQKTPHEMQKIQLQEALRQKQVQAMLQQQQSTVSTQLKDVQYG